MSANFGLQVSDDGRGLVCRDGMPFFWLGDTAWELFHRLTRESAEQYLRHRADDGYNVIQAVALSEFDGLTTPNAYGRVPLLRNGQGEFDPTLPDVGPEPGGYSYWDHMDFIIGRAEELGLYIAMLPTWGDKITKAWGKGPEIFHPQNAYEYGRWIGERYRGRPNVIWVLGGDRPLTKRSHFEIVRHMAQGIREGDGGGRLMTYHPCGEQSASHHMLEEDWLNFCMIQSGHGNKLIDNYKLVSADYAATPVKPTLDAEPCYEDHPRGFNSTNGYFDAADVRQAAYYALFSGAFGHTYGHHCVWGFQEEQTPYFIMNWRDALHRPGGRQMKHARTLMESRPMPGRVPDRSLLADHLEGANYMTAIRGERHAFIYSPNGLAIRAAMGRIAGETVAASWFDPRTGEFREAGVHPNVGEIRFQPPTCGRGNDWILVLDAQ